MKAAASDGRCSFDMVGLLLENEQYVTAILFIFRLFVVTYTGILRKYVAKKIEYVAAMSIQKK